MPPPPSPHDPPTRLRSLGAALRGRCPHCARGRLFRRLLELADTCDVCGLRFDDDGSAVTAGMVFGFGVPLLVALPLGFALIARDAPLAMSLGAPAAVVIGAVPAVVRFSKAVWVWLMDGLGYLTTGA